MCKKNKTKKQQQHTKGIKNSIGNIVTYTTGLCHSDHLHMCAVLVCLYGGAELFASRSFPLNTPIFDLQLWLCATQSGQAVSPGRAATP